MTARKRMIKGGFTLVEILIVVVILGILAAIVIPQFTNASESAKASSLTSTLQTIRSQLELAKVQHKGVYPALASTTGAEWDKLTSHTETDTSYTEVATADLSGDEVGPYLQQAPSNPFAADTVDPISVAADTSAAWQYDQTTGAIKAVVVMTGAQAEALGLVDDATDTSSNEVVLVAP